MLLALDTATRYSGLALFDGQRALAELNWHSDNGQTQELLPRLAQLLAWQGLEPAALDAVAVGLGPGSFTGLRVALSAAKGLALAHNLPLVGVPSLDATAYPHLGRAEPVCAVIQAGRGRVCWALYRADSALDDHQAASIGDWSGWRTSYRLSSIAELAGHIHQPTWFSGEILPATRDALQENLGQSLRRSPASPVPRSTAVLAALGWQRLQAGQTDDLASLSPIYLREP